MHGYVAAANAPPEERYFRSAPTSTRRGTAWAFLCVEGTLAVIAIAALHGSAPPYFDVVGAVVLLPVVAYGLIRASHISVTANEHEVRVANQFRNYRLAWSDIDRVQLDALATPLGAYRPAILFRRTSGRRVKAQAVSNLRSEQEAIMKDLRRVAPAEVVIDTEVDKYRPRPLINRQQ